MDSGATETRNELIESQRDLAFSFDVVIKHLNKSTIEY